MDNRNVGFFDSGLGGLTCIIHMCDGLASRRDWPLPHDHIPRRSTPSFPEHDPRGHGLASRSKRRYLLLPGLHDLPRRASRCRQCFRRGRCPAHGRARCDLLDVDRCPRRHGDRLLRSDPRADIQSPCRRWLFPRRPRLLHLSGNEEQGSRLGFRNHHRRDLCFRHHLGFGIVQRYYFARNTGSGSLNRVRFSPHENVKI